MIASLKGLATFYSFSDIASQPLPPFNINCDLKKNLESIENNVRKGIYRNDYHFQRHVLDSFNCLSDAHTLYRTPAGYSSCFFIRPFDLESAYITDRQNQAFFLRPGPLGASGADLWKEKFNFDPTQYYGQSAIFINNASVAEYLYTKFVPRNIGFYKDNKVKYNAALRKRWAQTPLSMFELDPSSLEYVSHITLENGREISVPNAVLCNEGFKSIQDVLDKNKKKPIFGILNDEEITKYTKEASLGNLDVYKDMEFISVNEEAIQADVPAVRLDDESVVIKQVDGKKIPTRLKSVSVPANNLKIVANDSYFESIHMTIEGPDGDVTPVYRLTSFLPSFGTYNVLEVFNNMLKEAESKNQKQLVVDISFNGGGILCLADLYAALLIEEWGNMSSSNPNAPLGYYDFRKSELTDAATENPVLGTLFTNPLFYLDIDSRTPYFDFSWYNPGINYTRGGKQSSYTSRTHYASICVDFPNGFDNPFFEPYKYYFDRVIVVTDGTCGSACSLFVSLLQQMKSKVVVVSYGGLYRSSETMDTSSFAGGNVLEWGLISTLTEYFGNHPNMPKQFPTSANARFNYHEYYTTRDAKIPREFTKMEADYHVHQWSPLYNADLTTENGRAAHANLYATAALIGKIMP